MNATFPLIHGGTRFSQSIGWHIMFLILCRCLTQNHSIKMILEVTSKLIKTRGADDAADMKNTINYMYVSFDDTIETFSVVAGNDYNQFSRISFFSLSSSIVHLAILSLDINIIITTIINYTGRRYGNGARASTSRRSDWMRCLTDLNHSNSKQKRRERRAKTRERC